MLFRLTIHILTQCNKHLIIVVILMSALINAYASFTPVTTTLPSIANTSVSWGDYDNDGDMDLFAMFSTVGSIPKVYRNDGNGVFTVVAEFMMLWEGCGAWGDYDNDGDLDIVIAGANYANPSLYTLLYRNDGDNVFTSMATNLMAVGAPSLSWGDYDNDGWLDLFLSGVNTSGTSVSYIYRNLQSELFVNINAGLQGVKSTHSSWVDYDNDGDIDLMTIGNYNTPLTKLYRNDGNGLFTSVATSIVDVHGGSSAWGDFDSDGDLDLLMSGYTSSDRITKIYRNDGNGNFTDINAGLPGLSSSKVSWGDFDNDGDLDIQIAGNNGTAYISSIYANANGVFSNLIANLTPNTSGTVSIADYDNDGDLDILSLGSSTTLYRNDNDDDPTPPTPPSLSMDPSSGTFTFTGSTDDTTPALGLTYNLRIGTTPGGCDVLSPMSNSATGYRSIVQGGRKVITKLILQPDVTYYASAQSIDNSYTASGFGNEIAFNVTWDYVSFNPVTTTLPDLSNSSVAWGDYDNDGDIDLFACAGDWSPAMSIHRNEGAGVFVNINASLVAVRSAVAAWGDYDNDGDLDILVAGEASGYSPKTTLYRNENNVFTQVGACFIDVRVAGIAWGDYDNDGYIDALINGLAAGGSYGQVVTRVY